MNAELTMFLSELNDDDALEVWEWLDSNPLAVEEMIAFIVESHPGIEEKS